MKWKNRMIALLLAFVLLLAGCRNGQLSATDDATVGTTADTTAGTTEYVPPTDETTESTEPEIAVTCQYLPQTVENPDNLPVLKWVCLTWRLYGGGERMWNEEAAVELNQMLADRNMPYRVQFVLLTTDQGLDNTQEWFTFPEAQEALRNADLIYAGMNETSMVEYLAPITEYVTGTAELSLKNAVAHEVNWLDGTVEGEIYGIGTIPKIAESDGWKVDPALLTAAGLTAEDFQRDYWEMDDVFARLYAANGNRPFLYLKDGYWQGAKGIHRNEVKSFNMAPLVESELLPQSYDAIGSFFSVDYSAETPVVVNYLESESSRKLTAAAFRYKDAKYTTEDYDQAKIIYKNLYTHSMLTYTADDGDLCIPVTEAYYNAPQSEGFISGVAAVSQHKEEAVSLLNLIAEDEAFQLQLFYGKEGRDYKIVDGYYEIIIQEDGSNYSLDFLSPLSCFCGLTSNMETENKGVIGPKNWGFYVQWGKTRLETYQDILDHCTYAYPILFDYSDLEQELTAMEKVFNQKYADSFARVNMTEAQRQQLVKDLKAAGSDKVLAELQRQLSEWQKNNPDWPLKPEE